MRENLENVEFPGNLSVLENSGKQGIFTPVALNQGN